MGTYAGGVPSFLAGEIPDADKFTQVSTFMTATIDDLGMMGCTLRRAANQTLPDASTTAVSWDTEDVDTDSLWTSGTTITIPQTGLWAITFGIVRAAVTTGRSFVEIVPSAGVYSTIGGSLRFAFNTGEGNVTGAAVIPLTATNTFVINVNADGVAASTMTAALTCYRVAGA